MAGIRPFRMDFGTYGLFAEIPGLVFPFERGFMDEFIVFAPDVDKRIVSKESSL